MLTINVICLLVVLICCLTSSEEQLRMRRLPMMRLPMRLSDLRKPVQNLRETIMRGRQMMQNVNRKEICYEIVGCFEIPRKHSPLQKVPEDPQIIDTKFYLFRRDINFSKPELLMYGDHFSSLNASSFKANNPIKVIIHGYLSRWNEKGALLGVEAYLNISDYNVIMVDWAKGAQGPSYTTAAANTELVGRQTGLLLLDMIKLGVDPKHIHLIGFSLGAHIAGCASEFLKQHGFLMGRITGLDPASPLFKHHLLREKSRKLDASDAHFVDVIHTDGSPVFTDGFGLLEPIGHVDYFPNGGREQPGCNDGRGSVVVAQLDKTLNREIACSHIRAWQLYLETLLNKANNDQSCKFIAYPCNSGLVSFTQGHCFPEIDNGPMTLADSFGQSYGYLGEDAKGLGPMYLVTRPSRPFCGSQLQATVRVSERTQATRGLLQLQLVHGNHTTNFQIKCELLDIIPTGQALYGLAASEYNAIHPNKTQTITARLSYLSLAFQNPEDVIEDHPTLYLDKIQIQDMYGNSWQYCGMETKVADNNSTHFEILTVTLNKNKC